MRIPNKFNGYSADNRRLYYDPATLAAMATAVEAASTAEAATAAATAASTAAAAAPTIATGAELAAGASAIPGIMGGADAALSAAAPGIAEGLGAGAQAMSPEIAANMVQNQAVNAGLNQGIMSGAAPAADQTAAMGIKDVAAANSPYELGSKAVPDVATNPVSSSNTSFADIYGKNTPGLEQPSLTEGLNIPKDVVGDPSLKASAEQIATKTPPNPLERGFNAAKQMAGDVSKFSKENPLLTTGGIMLAQNLMQPSYSGGPPKKDYHNKQGNNFQYTAPTTGEYTPIFKPTPYAVGGPVEQMSAENAIGGNMMYPQSQMTPPMYSNPMMARPMPNNIISSGIDAPVDGYSGEPRMASGGNVQGYAEGGKMSAFERMMKEEKARQEAQQEAAQAAIEKGKSLNPSSKAYSRTQSTNSPYAASVKELQAMGKKYGIPMAAPAKTHGDLLGDQDQMEYAANGGIMHGLGGYSDGGRLLKGPGDGVSDSIPAVIGNKQPARLADGEFVVPARIVSELGNGSTEAGARKLYAMMERIQKQRGKTTGKGKVAVNSKADKHLPA